MDYKKHYELLVARARYRAPIDGYVERHHIVPKCMGGRDTACNLIELTPEEHFVAHVLLAKIYPEHDGLIIAINKMCRGHKGRRTRKMYGWLKRRFSEVQSKQQTGEGNSQYGTRWVNDGSKSFKLKKDEALPLGWSEGRLYSKPLKQYFCQDCGIQVQTYRQKYCSCCRSKKLSQASRYKRSPQTREKMSRSAIIRSKKYPCNLHKVPKDAREESGN